MYSKKVEHLHGLVHQALSVISDKRCACIPFSLCLVVASDHDTYYFCSQVGSCALKTLCMQQTAHRSWRAAHSG